MNQTVTLSLLVYVWDRVQAYIGGILVMCCLLYDLPQGTHDKKQITAAVCVLTDFGSLRRNSPQFTVCTDKDAVEQLVSFFSPREMG